MPLPRNESSGASRRRVGIWIAIWGLALSSRFAAMFLLPNAELDGYSYVETIADWSAKLRAGNFHIADLSGFWLPLFQFLAAIANLLIGHPLLAGKLLSALCGSITCVLVFVLTERLTRNLFCAAVALALILLNPFHILYSAAAMTDVPFTCLLLASLCCVMEKRWIGAALFGALAEFTRLEGWMLVVLLPMIQLAVTKRLSIVPILILSMPPLLWLGVNQIATGDSFAYFAIREKYQTSFLEFSPTRQKFFWSNIRSDLDCFLLGANGIAFLAILAAAIVSIRNLRRSSDQFDWRVLSTFAYAGAILVFLVAAYVTKRQPVILPRYALIFFLLGLPLLAQLLCPLLRRSLPWKLVAGLVFTLCLVESKAQLPTIGKVIADFHAQQRIADALVREMKQSHCFSDDSAVRVLSGLPPESFVRTPTVPPSAAVDRAAFESYLHQAGDDYLVFMRIDNSLPAKLFPELGRQTKVDTGHFQLVAIEFSTFGPDIWLYRLLD